MKNSFPLAQKMLPEIYSTVDMIMKGRPLLVLLLFAASAVILAGMYYAATREGTTTRQDKWAGVLSDLDACSRRKHVKSAQYDHFAGIARQEREHDAERLFRAMAHAIQASKLRWQLLDQSLPPLTFDQVFWLSLIHI